MSFKNCAAALLACFYVAPAIACIPAPREYVATTQPIYLQIDNTYFVIPEKYVSVHLPGKTDYFEIWYRAEDVGTNRDFKVHMKNREEIKVGNRHGFRIWADSALVSYRDGLFIPRPYFNTESDVKQFIDQFVVTQKPADWDKTIELAEALEVAKLAPLAPCAFSQGYKPIDPKTIGAPKVEVIEEALKNKNQGIRAIAVKWLSINAWGLTDVIGHLDAIEKQDASVYVREEAKLAKAKIARDQIQQTNK